MSKLEELEEELYGKDEKKLQARLPKRVVLPSVSGKSRTMWFEPERPARTQKSNWRRKALMMFLGALLIALMIGGALLLFFYLGTRGQEATLTFHGGDTIDSGGVLTIPVAFKNVSKTILREVELTFILPEDALYYEGGLEKPAPPRVLMKLDDLAPGEEGVREITVRMFGKEGEQKKIDALLLYRPESLRARFSTKITKVLTVARVPLAISWNLPQTLSRGQSVDVVVRWRASGEKPFTGMSLRLEYPPGFTYVSSEPKASLGDALWELGTLESGKEGTIIVHGVISGEEGEIKSFKAGLGVFNTLTKDWKPYSESSVETKIAEIPLSVQVFLGDTREGIIDPGAQLQFSLRYRNSTASTLKNITIRAFLEGSIVELNTLTIDNGGVFDATGNSLVWGPGSNEALRTLEAGKEGVLTFRVNTKTRPIVRSTQDMHQVVRVRATIDAAGIPKELQGTNLHAEDLIQLKVRSKIIFEGKSLYRASPLLNSGPLPPKVNEKTVYTIMMEIRNFTNALHNVEARGVLPPNIKWENVISPSDARIAYDAASGEVRWRIGEVKAGVGLLSPALVGAFQVSLIPSEVDVGKSPILFRELRLTGTDSFTEDARVEEVPTLTTELREDETTSHTDWEVVR